MEQLALKNIAKLLNNSNKNIADNIVISDICTDTRKIEKGCLFVALKGENFDGHDYIAEAFELGAVAAISSRKSKLTNIIVVEDTQQALVELAGYYRGLFSPFVVGITGSVGKTSTKEMVYAILSYKNKTLKTEGNLNNEIGLPLTMFQLDQSYKNAVFEMGMSGFGEISLLTNICHPNVAIITNIGISHIEALGSRENILKAKLEILDSMSHDAPLILNKDNDLLRDVHLNIEHPVVYYAIDEKADIYATDIKQSGNETTFKINFYGKSIEASIPTVGKHNVYNALAGFSIGLIVDMKPTEIVAAMRRYETSGMRQNVAHVNGVVVIADCYNASPDSMKAALDVIKNVECHGKRYCVFGDMLELGDFSEQEHLEVGREVARANVGGLFCCGNEARLIKRGAIMAGMKEVAHFDDRIRLAEHLSDLLVPGDAVIFKASRGMQFEAIIEELKRLWDVAE